MKIRMTMLGLLATALAGCTTTSGGMGGSPLEARWIGKSAGTFFANFGPPISDTGEGGTTSYTWKGGYKTVKIPAKYAEGENGKKGKRISAGGTRYMNCTVMLKVDESYTIRSIKAISDRPGVNGPSYCTEFLAGDTAK